MNDCEAVRSVHEVHEWSPGMKFRVVGMHRPLRARHIGRPVTVSSACEGHSYYLPMLILQPPLRNPPFPKISLGVRV